MPPAMGNGDPFEVIDGIEPLPQSLIHPDLATVPLAEYGLGDASGDSSSGPCGPSDI